jgi:tetratricopeptide (TPR) repeat protein
MPIKKYVALTSYLLVFLISSGLIAYGWLMLQFDTAQKALRRGDLAQAMEIYAPVEAAFHKIPSLPDLLKNEYKHLSFNQVSVLYSQRKNQEALAKLEQLTVHAPALAESSDYSFWMGNLLFRQAAESKDSKTSVNALKTAMSEYQRGLAAQPDDWDLKFNYELVRKVFSQQDRDRQKQEQKVKSIIEKMRPQEPSRQEIAPEKRG